MTALKIHTHMHLVPTCAILVIAFRLFARPGELCNLKWSVLFKKDSTVQFDLSGYKTDEFDIVVDPNKNNPKVGPVTVLKKFQTLRKLILHIVLV